MSLEAFKGMSNHLEEMAVNYSDSWRVSGLDIPVSQARREILSFNPDYTYLFREPENGEVSGQIHTLPAHIKSMEDFVDQFPSEAEVKKAAGQAPPHDINSVLCFSLNCKLGRYVDNGDGHIPLPLYVLKNVPTPPRAYKFGYSFMTMENPRQRDAVSMLKRYQNLIESGNTRGGGPAMMHEAFGAIVAAFIEEGRPGHTLAAEGVTVVVYPRGRRESKYFEEVKRGRIAGNIPVEKHKDSLILKDLDLSLT